MTRSYFLAPNFDIPPDGPLSLGNIITDPTDPCYSLNLSQRAAELDSKPYYTFKDGFTATRTELREGKFGIWAQILEMYGFGAEHGMKYDKSTDDVYSINRIDTNFFVPSRAYLEANMGGREVREYLDACRWRKTVYIVTGLKIARGARLTSSGSRGLGVNIRFGVDGTPAGVPGGMGIDMGVERKERDSLGFENSSDFVFAFQLRKVRYRKWKPVTHEPYNKGAVFNADEGKEAEATVEILDLEEEGDLGDEIMANEMKVIREVHDGKEALWFVPAQRI